MASHRVQRVAVSSTPGGGRRVILETGQTSVNTGPPVIQGVTELQVLGGFTGTVTADVDSLAPGGVQDVSFTCALAPGIPNAFTLTAGSSGLITASVALVTLPDDSNLIVSCPALSLTFGTGLPTQVGSGTWTLRPQIQYQGPQVNGSIRCYGAAKTSATTLTFVLFSTLLGQPAAE